MESQTYISKYLFIYKRVYILHIYVCTFVHVYIYYIHKKYINVYIRIYTHRVFHITSIRKHKIHRAVVVGPTCSATARLAKTAPSCQRTDGGERWAAKPAVIKCRFSSSKTFPLGSE